MDRLPKSWLQALKARLAARTKKESESQWNDRGHTSLLACWRWLARD